MSPTAGLFGQPTTDTTGILEMSRPRYLNLHQCTYHSDTFNDNVSFVGDTANPGTDTGTNVSNTADTSVACAPGAVNIGTSR